MKEKIYLKNFKTQSCRPLNCTRPFQRTIKVFVTVFIFLFKNLNFYVNKFFKHPNNLYFLDHFRKMNLMQLKALSSVSLRPKTTRLQLQTETTFLNHLSHQPPQWFGYARCSLGPACSWP